MKTIEIKKKDVDYREYVKRTAVESDFDTLIKEPCILTEDGNIRIIYDIIDIDTESLVNDLKRVEFHEGKRTRGLVSISRIFGFRPRSAIRGEYCSATSLAFQQPDIHAKVCGLALEIEKYYEKYNSEGFNRHKNEVTEKVKGEWRINGKSIFTSGIINKNNPLKYHFDTGNFNGVYSMMIVFKEGIEGGYLSMPEYGLGIELRNNSIIMFDGQAILHGVTPITKTVPTAHRFSIVYYSLKQMWKCLEINDELARIKNKKTQRERIRHTMPPEHRAKLEKARGKQ